MDAKLKEEIVALIEEQLNKPKANDMLKMVPDSFAPGLRRVSLIKQA